MPKRREQLGKELVVFHVYETNSCIYAYMPIYSSTHDKPSETRQFRMPTDVYSRMLDE
jgi:hypothetical protein